MTDEPERVLNAVRLSIFGLNPKRFMSMVDKGATIVIVDDGDDPPTPMGLLLPVNEDDLRASYDTIRDISFESPPR